MTDNPALQPIPEESARKYTPADAIFALLFFALGYFRVRWCFFGNTFWGLGPLIAILAVFAISIVYLRIRKRPISRRSVWHLAVILGVSSGLFFSDNRFIRFLIVFYAWTSWLLWFFRTGREADDAEREADDGMLFFDLLKSVLVMPFSCLGSVFTSIWHSLIHFSFGKKLLLAMGGLFIAVIPTAVVLRLLINADGAFANLTDQIYTNLLDNLSEHIEAFFLGIPIAMFMFGALYASGAGLHRDVLTRRDKDLTKKSIRILPALFTAAAVTPILVVYGLFFFSQTSYFLSAFSGIRPADFTYAQYARQGFFELCGVSVINLVIIAAAGLFTKRQEEKRSPAVTVYTATLSVFTLILIAIALSKMFMYIGAYGLTLLRIYSTWFMLLLAVLFLLILLRQFWRRLPLIRVFSVCFTVMFAVLIFSNVDAITARYNVYLYQSGKTDRVDIYMMYDLSDAAVEYVLPLTDDPDESVARKAREYIREKREAMEARPDTFDNFNLAAWLAERAVENYGK